MQSTATFVELTRQSAGSTVMLDISMISMEMTASGNLARRLALGWDGGIPDAPRTARAGVLMRC